MAILSPEEYSHRGFLLKLAQALRLPPGTPFQKRALKTPLEDWDVVSEFLDEEGDEDDWVQLQLNCLERAKGVMDHLDAFTEEEGFGTFSAVLKG